MLDQLANIVPMETGVERKHITVAFSAAHIAVRGRMPVGIRLENFVASGARTAARVAVINASRGQKQSGEDRECKQHIKPSIPWPASGHRTCLTPPHAFLSTSSPGSRRRNRQSP